MLQRPRLKPYLTAYPLDDKVWAIRGGSDEVWRLKLNDTEAFRTLGALFSALDGHFRHDELITHLGHRGFASTTVAGLLSHLEVSSFLEEASPETEREAPFDHQEAFFSRFTHEGGSLFQARLASQRVAVVGDGPLAEALLCIARDSGIGELCQLGDPVRPDPGERDLEPVGSASSVRRLPLHRERVWIEGELGSPPDLLLVAQQAHDEALLEAIDDWSKRTGRPWLLVRHLDLREGWVGPLFLPGETASYRSLQARLAGNLPHFDEYQAFDQRVRTNPDAKAPGALLAFLHTLAGIAVTEAVKLLAGVHVPHLLSRFLTLDLWSWEIEAHEVLRVPGLDRPPAAQPAPFPWRGDDHGLEPREPTR